MGRLDNKVALITGAGSGIGRGAAILFAKEGAKVVVDDLIAEKAKGTVKMIREAGGEAVYVQADVSKAEDVKKMIKTTVDTFGRLDVLWNNAGILGPLASTVDITEEDFDKLMATNLKGVWLGMKYGIPEMLKVGGGSIISTASMCAMEGMGGLPVYSSSKGGIVSLSKVTAREYAKFKIRVNCIDPGVILTSMTEFIEHDEPEVYKRLMEETIGRLGTPEDIAQLGVYLASDESTFVTGAAIAIDGGVTSGSMLSYEVT